MLKKQTFNQSSRWIKFLIVTLTLQEKYRQKTRSLNTHHRMQTLADQKACEPTAAHPRFMFSKQIIANF
jgi:hypothetical protein